MKVTVSSADLKKALANGKKAQAKGGYTNMPHMSGVRISTGQDSITLSTTDLDLSADVTIPATVHDSGEACVSLAELAGTAKGKGELALVLEDGKLTVHGTTVSSIPVMDLNMWPKALDVKGPAFSVDLSAVAEVASAASVDQCRPILTGILFDGDNVTATDSYRLHSVNLPGVSFPTTLIPARAFKAAGKSGTVELTFEEPTASAGIMYVKLSAGNTVWTVRTIDGTFPNWKQLVPAKTTSSVTVNRAGFRALLDAVKPGAKSAIPVRLTFTDLNVTADVIEQDVSARTGTVALFARTGDLEAVGFNPAFLLSALDAGRAETVTLDLVDALRPGVIRDNRPDGSTGLVLLMPVRMS